MLGLIIILGAHGAYGWCTPSVTTASGTLAPQRICSGYLIFEDNFDYLDHGVWEHEDTLPGKVNGEFQHYVNSRANSLARYGILKIRPTLARNNLGERALRPTALDYYDGFPTENCASPEFYGCRHPETLQGNPHPIKSARIRTKRSFSFRYGHVMVRAKMPVGDWLWPAIWLLPRQGKYGPWPKSGEIDIVECRGNRHLFLQGSNIGVHQVGSTLNWGFDREHNGFRKTHWTSNDPEGFHVGFHTYELIWTPEQIIFKVDNHEIGRKRAPEYGFWDLGGFNSTGLENPWAGSRSKMAPFDQEFYLVMNLAVGGTGFFPDNASNPGGKPWRNPSPSAMGDFWKGRKQWLPTWNLDGSDDATLQVDYVRVYAL